MEKREKVVKKRIKGRTISGARRRNRRVRNEGAGSRNDLAKRKRRLFVKDKPQRGEAGQTESNGKDEGKDSS